MLLFIIVNLSVYWSAFNHVYTKSVSALFLSRVHHTTSTHGTTRTLRVSTHHTMFCWHAAHATLPVWGQFKPAVFNTPTMTSNCLWVVVNSAPDVLSMSTVPEHPLCMSQINKLEALLIHQMLFLLLSIIIIMFFSVYVWNVSRSPVETNMVSVALIEPEITRQCPLVAVSC